MRKVRAFILRLAITPYPRPLLGFRVGPATGGERQERA